LQCVLTPAYVQHTDPRANFQRNGTSLPVDELSITERLRKRVRIPTGSPIVTGIGDDCAIYRPRGSADDLLLTTDLFIEGIHFLRDTHTAADAGHKALARSLSDIAAMGGSPRLCLVSLCVAPWTTDKWIDGFYKGLLDLAAGSNTVLAGGDLSHSDKCFADVMAMGSVPRGSALLRSGGRVGDDIYVSGRLGGSVLGLEKRSGTAWKRHKRPEPRLALATIIRERYRPTAAMDLSDGLSLDLRRLCLASGIAAEIAEPPCFKGASLAHALHGGEDYELLFTVRHGTEIPAKLEGVELTRIGRTTTGIPGQILLDGAPLPALGYDHFK